MPSPLDQKMLDILEDRLRRYENLIRWLALPWADNDPDFLAYDHFSHQELPENEELEQTWVEVVRHGVPLSRPDLSQVLVVCPACLGTRKTVVSRDEVSGSLTLSDSACSLCAGEGYLPATPKSQ